MADPIPQREAAPGSAASRRSLALEVPLTLVLALIAIGSFVFPRALHWLDGAPLAGSPPHLLIEQVDASSTDASGRLYRRLRADELRRAAPNAKSMLVRPRVTVFPANGPRWHFEAETGEVSPDGKTIYLPGLVLGRRAAAEPLELASRDLRIRATDNYGESDAPATVRGRAFEARGTGVKIWLDEGRIEFLSDARAVMQPK